MLEATLRHIPPSGIKVSELARLTDSKYYSMYARLHYLKAFGCVEVDNGIVFRGPNYVSCLKLLGISSVTDIKTSGEAGGTAYALLGDIHIGRLADGFNLSVIEQMVDKYTQHLQHLKELGYHIIGLGLGDYVDGAGIYPRQEYEQELDPNEQVSAFIDLLEPWFELVDAFYGIAGNHGRTNEHEHGNYDYMALTAMKAKYRNKLFISPRHVEVFSLPKDVVLLAHITLRTYYGLPDYSIRRFVQSHIVRRRDLTMAALGHFHTPKYMTDIGIPIVLNGSFLVDSELGRKYGLIVPASQVIVIKSSNNKYAIEVLEFEHVEEAYR